MKRMIIGGILVLVVAVLMIVSRFAPISLAQSGQPAVQWVQITIVNIKPEMANDWIALQRSDTIPGLQKAGVLQRDAWETAVFGQGFEYFFSQPIAKMADFEQRPPMVRALGEQGAAAYNAKLRRMVNTTRILAIQQLPDSILPSASYAPKLGILTLTTVTGGREADYENYLKTEFMPVARRAKPAGYLLSRTIFGGEPNEFGTLRFIDSFADIDAGPLTTRVLGAADAAKLNAKTAGMVTHMERRIYRYSPELSFKVRRTSQAH